MSNDSPKSSPPDTAAVGDPAEPLPPPDRTSLEEIATGRLDPEEVLAADARPSSAPGLDPAGTPSPVAASPSRRVRAREWLLRTGALQKAELEWGAVAAPERTAIERARACVEAAARLVRPFEPLPGGLSGAYPAWHLLQIARGDLGLVCDAEPTEERLTDERVAEEQVLLEAEVARRVEPRRRGEDLLVSRWLRLASVVLGGALVLLFVGFAWRKLARGGDLAARAARKQSSTYAVCQPAKLECAGVHTSIQFHTNEEESPWVEYELPVPSPVSRVVIQNRSDFGPDRAVPLVVEVSTDRKKWTEVGRQDQPFDSWTVKFPKTTARVVRIRVARKSILHLESVEIY